MRIAFALVLAALFAGCIPPKTGSGYRSFQLVYNSDTRGYYQPCG
jgi:hypothetical protein